MGVLHHQPRPWRQGKRHVLQPHRDTRWEQRLMKNRNCCNHSRDTSKGGGRESYHRTSALRPRPARSDATLGPGDTLLFLQPYLLLCHCSLLFSCLTLLILVFCYQFFCLFSFLIHKQHLSQTLQAYTSYSHSLQHFTTVRLSTPVVQREASLLTSRLALIQESDIYLRGKREKVKKLNKKLLPGNTF